VPQGGAVDRLVAERLADAGVRYTRARRAIVNALRAAEGPESAAELDRRLRGRVPISSLYRTLSVLEQAGVVSPQLAEWLSGHHHHLVCDQCGKVEDAEVDAGRERILEELAGALVDGFDFLATGHSLEVEGLCASCRR